MGVETGAEELLFREVILPSQFLVRWVTIGMSALFLFAFALMPVSPWLTGSMALMACLFTWWMRSSKLVTEVRPSGMKIRMSPFPASKVPASEIEGWRVHMAYPWGIGKRGWSLKKSPGVTVYMAGCKPGLVIGLKGQKGIWLSSDQPDQIANALSKAIPRRKK